MKVVHVYKDYHPPVRGGIEQTVERLADYQVRSGLSVTVLTSAHGGRRTVEELVDGVRVIRVAEWARVASAPVCPSMPWHLSKIEADIVHLHFPNPTGEVSYLLVRPRGVLAVTYHADIVRQAALLPIYGSFIEALLRRADVILPTSARYIEHSRWLRRYRDKCRVVPSGIDLERFDRLDRSSAPALALRAAHAGPIVLFVGRLRYYKGLDVLIDTMRQVSATLVIVGGGPEERALRRRTRQAGLDGRVVFAGSVGDDEMLAYLAAADVGVLPSTYPSEALGLAMVEMMACGIPVVCTELGTGTSFVNLHEETGLVVPPRDAAALAQALNRLLGDASLRARYGAAARRRAREVFSGQAMADGVAAAYEDALRRRGATA